MSRHVRQPERRQTPLDVSDDRDPVGGEIHNGRDDKSEPEHRQGGRHDGQEPLHGQRDDQQPRAQNHRGAVRVAELRDDLADDREEIARRDADTQELAELGCDHDQRDAVDIPEQHRLAEEIRQEPQPEDARQEEQRAHRERQRRCQGEVARRIDLAADHRDRRDRHRRQSGQSGVGPDHVLPRRPQEAVHPQRQEGPVEPVDDRQPGQLGHRQRRGDRDGTDRHAGNEVGAQERARVVKQRRQSRCDVGHVLRDERAERGHAEDRGTDASHLGNPTSGGLLQPCVLGARRWSPEPE